MKKHRTTLIMVLFFFIGLLILLYPSISNYYNEKHQSKAIVDYEKLLQEIDMESYDEVFSKAEEYNNQLRSFKYPFVSYKKLKNYDKTLDINGKGMMGYLRIDKIKVELPIYHGTSEEILAKSIGHLEGSSLPIGGLGNHSVLSAHRGLPSSKLFTDLDKLEIGDTFVITILNRVLTYEVDNIKVVKPNEVKNLNIDKDEDYVTLLTCTPYGINTHRLLVRGKRIENEVEKKLYITTECFRINNLIVTPIVALPIILILLLIIIFKPVERNVNEVINKYIYPEEDKSKE